MISWEIEINYDLSSTQFQDENNLLRAHKMSEAECPRLGWRTKASAYPGEPSYQEWKGNINK